MDSKSIGRGFNSPRDHFFWKEKEEENGEEKRGEEGEERKADTSSRLRSLLQFHPRVESDGSLSPLVTLQVLKRRMDGYCMIPGSICATARSGATPSHAMGILYNKFYLI